MKTREKLMCVGAMLIPCVVYKVYEKEIKAYTKKQRDKMLKYTRKNSPN